MTAGQLRDRALFQAEELVPDGGGGSMLEWVDKFTVRARLMPGTVAERLQAGALQASAQAMLRVRLSSDTEQIRADWRVVIKGATYNIRQHPEDPYRTRQWLDMLIERGVAT
jgi:SPP1 family predicted phage head-tail adaptor